LDKFEYKIKADEIKELIAQGAYEQAAEIADSIDWRRVKSVMMLCTVSDLYKICRRYEDSRDMLLLAYERHPGGRTIVYSLCELSIKMEEFVQAVEYYKEFVEIAPKDSGRFILQYKLYEAQDVSLEERIAVLEELKKRDYREKWAYELAYLYHRVGLATKCVEECDELFLWFGNGKYVIKALELKKLHAPLNEEQQYQYDNRFNQVDPDTGDHQQAPEAEVQEAVTGSEETVQVTEEAPVQEDVLTAETIRIPVEEIEIQVKTLEVGKYDTINLQEELAAGIQEYFGTTGKMNMIPAEVPVQEEPSAKEEALQSEVFFGETGEVDLEHADVQQLQDKTVGEIVDQSRMMEAQPPKEMAGVLAMDGDGQISFVLPPEKDPVEKQITGQISINDIILEWERLKKENEEKRQEEVRQRVLQQTGPMFTEFEAAVRDGLLEQLEKGQVQEDSPEVQLAELFEDNKELQEDTEDIGEVEELTEILEVTEDSVEVMEDTAEVEEVVEIEEAVEEAAESVEETETVKAAAESVEETEIVEETVESVEEAEAVEEAAEPVEEPEVVEEAAESVNEPEAVEETIESVNEAEAVEEAAESVKETEIVEEAVEPVKEAEAVEEKQKLRNLTREERELYGKYIQGRSTKEQIIKAVDSISMASYTGNVIVTGDEGMDSLGLAKNMIREVQMTDSNFSGKIAKISGETLNTRDIKQIVDDLNNGALIIQKASQMKPATAEALYKVLQEEYRGIVVAIEDTKKMMDRFLNRNQQLLSCFTARVDIAALSNDALVAFARKYAREKEYSIDQMGLLALHTRIEELQTSDHAVTILEVKEIVDEAIKHADRKTIGHFFDILFAKRYDDEDMIILKEKDFI